MSAEQLGRLIDEHAAALTLFARSLCGCPDDVVQEAFIKLAQVHPWPDCAKAWLYRAVRNGAISATRSARRRGKHEAAAALASKSWFLPNVENAIDAQTAAAALQQLPESLREVVVLRLWSQMTFQEIAELIQASDSTAQRRFVEAREILRKQLEVPCLTKPEHQSR